MKFHENFYTDRAIYLPEQIFETFMRCSRTREQDAVNACWKPLQVLLALHLLFCASRFDLSTSKVAAIFTPCAGFVSHVS